MSSIPGWSYGESPFHAGEQSIQYRLGLRDKIEDLGRRIIRNQMPEQHQAFLRQLPFLIVGTQDNDGQPWASILTNPAGFANALDEQHLRINALPNQYDPLLANLHVGAAIGLLGIEPPTRRRNRLNGMVSFIDDTGFTVAVQRSFGNCPKYIQARVPTLIETSVFDQARVRSIESSKLDSALQQMIRATDTFYIASSFNDTVASASSCPHGVDVSHRGGKPGFVRVDDASTLTVPDYAGNNYFNTLGNLLIQPKAGLLLIDFSEGDLLYIAARAEIIWEGAEVKQYEGAQRLLRLHVTSTQLVKRVLPLRWSEAELSPFLEPMGSWANQT